jgi:hypothetical protein
LHRAFLFIQAVENDGQSLSPILIGEDSHLVNSGSDDLSLPPISDSGGTAGTTTVAFGVILEHSENHNPSAHEHLTSKP